MKKNDHTFEVQCTAEERTLGTITVPERAIIDATLMRRRFQPKTGGENEHDNRRLVEDASDGKLMLCPRCKNAVVLAKPGLDYATAAEDGVRVLMGQTRVDTRRARKTPAQPKAKNDLRAQPVFRDVG